MMRVLMDTHTFLWFAADDPRLSVTARALIEDTDTEPLVSIASAWDIGIKVGPGKLSMDRTIEELFTATAARQISVLPISLPHAIDVRDLADIIETHSIDFSSVRPCAKICPS